MNKKIEKALELLNLKLEKMNRTIEVRLVGSYAIELLGVDIGRMTEDIDPVRVETLDKEVINAVSLIEDKLDLPDWFDLGATTLPLPEGHEERLIEIDKYSQIKLSILSRADLISLKVYAYHQRKERTRRDLSDLKRMKPSISEILQGLEFLKSQGPNVGKFRKEFKKDVLETADEVFDELGL